MKKIGRIVKCAALCCTIAFAASGAARAQGTAQQRSACEGDAFKFCFSDIPSVSAIEACLKANEPKLSPACQAEFAPAKKTILREEHFRKN